MARRTSLHVPLPVAIVAGSLLLGALSLLLPSAPTYDPFAWIIWGREIMHLDLNTVGGPSWKPLPVVVTTLTAPLGEASPYVWLAVARAGAIAGTALAFVLAARLAGPVAGAAAAIGLGLMPWWVRNGVLGNSEGLLVAFVLGVALAHLHGRRGWAFAFAIGAGLLRPEAWPFAGLYALWLLREDRTRARWVAGGLAALPLLWLAPEWWGSGNPFRASDRAQEPNANSPAFADEPALQVVANAVDLVPGLAVAGAAAALVAAAVLHRGARDRHGGRTVLALALLAIAWVGLVAFMTSRGFSGNQRYLMVPGALVIVLGAVGVVWAARALAPASARLPRLAAVAAAAALGAAFVVPDRELLRVTVRGVAYQADLYHDLGRLIERAGGADRLVACGRPYTGPFLVPHVAWRLGVHTSEVRLEPAPPGVVFHVRTVEGAPIVPPLEQARPRVLARAGHWLLTSDCEGGR